MTPSATATGVPRQFHGLPPDLQRRQSGYAYAHVPSGWTGDATDAITAQIERFAPGFRDRVRATFVRSTTDLAQENANYLGGDIVTGCNDVRQPAFRPA